MVELKSLQKDTNNQHGSECVLMGITILIIFSKISELLQKLYQVHIKKFLHLILTNVSQDSISGNNMHPNMHSDS
jgi:hypothetical protein